MNLERTFQLLSVAFAAVSAFFLWRTDYDAMFVTAVIGAVAFFLSIRMQVKARLDERKAVSDAEDNPETGTDDIVSR